MRLCLHITERCYKKFQLLQIAQSSYFDAGIKAFLQDKFHQATDSELLKSIRLLLVIVFSYTYAHAQTDRVNNS